MRSISLLLVLLGGLSALAGRLDEKAADPASAKPVRIASGVTGHIHPAVCVGKTGTIVVIFSKADFKDLRLTRSTDGGKTWTEPTAFLPTEKLSIYPGSLTTLADGRMVHAWNTWYTEGKEAKSRFVQFSISSDDGKTWSEPTSLPKNPEAHSVIRHPLVEMKPGEWLCSLSDKTVTADPANGKVTPFAESSKHGLVPIVRTAKGTFVSGAGLRSTDQGKTWEKILPFPKIGSDGWRYDLVALSNGLLVASEVLGPGAGGNLWRFVVSRDDGKSWDFDGAMEFYNPGRPIGGRACPRTVQLDRDTIGTVFYDVDEKQPGGSGVFFLRTAIARLDAKQAAEPAAAANSWVKLDKASIEGRRWDVPVGYSPELKRFLVLGGRITFADAKKARSYDQLVLDSKEGRWENYFPKGKDWGPKFGPCQPPAWKNEVWGFQDAEGNVRPNWTVYGTFSLGQQYDYDPDTKSFVFRAAGKTFRYDPVERQWTDLAPKTDPEKELGGILLWSSMCYDRQNKRFILFGGGNIQSERGDPGTWTYTPASNTWGQLKLDAQPPQRANSRLVYDPVNKKVVLFGGDQLDQLLADTWTFDVSTQKWEQKKPARSPSPRAGHALLWLPRAKKVLLLGGYGYTSAVGYVESLYRRLPLEAWVYDTAADRWDLVKRFEGKEIPEGPANFFLSAAADEDDNILVVGSNGTWTCRLDGSKPDADATAKHGVAPGTVDRRTGPHDPAWFKEGVPPADPAKSDAELKGLPANQWVQRATPRLPRPNMDWGSAVFAPDLDLILRFSGGHSAYSGTAPQIYDIKTDRYSIPFVPEYPIEYVYSNDQVHGEWSFKGNPWMTGHTYKSTGYDLNLKSLVFAPHDYNWFFDPKTGKWSRSTERNPYRPNMYVVTLAATPQGAVVWADKRESGVGLWRLDASSRSWKALPLTGTLPNKSPDQHGMAYDAKRDRLLFFSNADKNKGDVASYDFKTGEAKWLNAAGKEKAAVQSRETIYLPELDAVLIGARVNLDGKQLWALYDCTKNAWFGAELPGTDPVGKGTFGNSFNNSMGLMYDPNRKLVWAVGQNSHVHVLRLDSKSLKLHELK